MKTVTEAVVERTTVRVWSASGDSRVGIATEFPSVEGQRRYAIQLINRPGHELLQLSGMELNRQWLLLPRIDVAWMHVGSVWVDNANHKLWNRPVPSHLRCEVVKGHDHNGFLTLSFKPKDTPRPQILRVTCFNLMMKYTRLWGLEVPKGEIPAEPMTYKAKTGPGRPKKSKPEPKSAFDRLLERDLLSE